VPAKFSGDRLVARGKMRHLFGLVAVGAGKAVNEHDRRLGVPRDNVMDECHFSPVETMAPLNETHCIAISNFSPIDRGKRMAPSMTDAATAVSLFAVNMSWNQMRTRLEKLSDTARVSLSVVAMTGANWLPSTRMTPAVCYGSDDP
jgi:hypothetical protein